MNTVSPAVLLLATLLVLDARAGAGQTVAKITDTTGRWRVALAPLPANSTHAPLTIAGANTLAFSDILGGEVWLVSDQSNRDLPLDKTYGADLQRLTSSLPAVREITVSHVGASSLRADSARKWRTTAPGIVGGLGTVACHLARDRHLSRRATSASSTGFGVAPPSKLE